MVKKELQEQTDVGEKKDLKKQTGDIEQTQLKGVDAYGLWIDILCLSEWIKSQIWTD